MPSYNTSQFRKGLKVQIDGDPYLMTECNFVKPGKGQALYKCKLKNLVRGSQLVPLGAERFELLDVTPERLGEVRMRRQLAPRRLKFVAEPIPLGATYSLIPAKLSVPLRIQL